MLSAPLAPDEAGRLTALARYRILDTEPERRFDDLTALAAQLCDAPIALVSLIDRDRQWFKSRFGLEARETHRDWAFCAHAILADELFVVRDALADERFADNPLVLEDPRMRFYAGARLSVPAGGAEQHALGTLCVIDRVPRELSKSQEQALVALSHQVVTQLELRLKVDELIRARDELRDARDRAEQANQTKSRFVTYMSHELRTPLNAIIGFANILLKRGSTTVEQEAVFLGRVLANGKHLLKLIDGILDLSAIEAGKLELRREAFDVAELVAEIVGQVEPLAATRGNTLLVRGMRDLGSMCSDRTKLGQCLQNLLSNACKYTEGGEITLSGARSRAQGQAWIALAVADTGPGIDAVQLTQLFEEYSRGPNRSDPREGTGLGLAITRRLCELLGGRITVASEPGQGSRFELRLPADGPGR